jgi:hypothetical protein
MIAYSRSPLRPLLDGVADAVSERMLVRQFDKPSYLLVVQVKPNIDEC